MTRAPDSKNDEPETQNIAVREELDEQEQIGFSQFFNFHPEKSSSIDISSSDGKDQSKFLSYKEHLNRKIKKKRAKKKNNPN